MRIPRGDRLDINAASRILKATVWYYLPAQWDGVMPLAVQIWGDGQQFTGPRPGPWRTLETLDNLTAQKRIPLMVSIFIQAGTGPQRNQRSIEYDTVNDAYRSWRRASKCARTDTAAPFRV